MLSKLEIYNFRNFEQFSVSFNAGINIITGKNGSGKSSILESIFYMSRGRSFRVSNSELLILDGKQDFVIRLNIDDIILASQKSKNGQAKQQISGIQCNSMLEVSEHIPVLFLDSNSQRWLAAGPKNRRQLIDWGLFYGKNQDFYPYWKNFRRCLLQRNSAIKKKQEFSSWDQMFIENSLKIDSLRESYISELQEEFDCLWAEELQSELGIIKFQYQKGWSNNLLTSLKNSRDRDMYLGHTSVGPHRADLVIKANGKLAHTYLSQGQQKTLTYLMTIAQSKLFSRHTNKSCILLLDDLCAELDNQKQSKILDYLFNHEHQIIMTSLETNFISEVSEKKHNHIII